MSGYSKYLEKLDKFSEDSRIKFVVSPEQQNQCNFKTMVVSWNGKKLQSGCHELGHAILHLSGKTKVPTDEIDSIIKGENPQEIFRNLSLYFKEVYKKTGYKVTKEEITFITDYIGMKRDFFPNSYGFYGHEKGYVKGFHHDIISDETFAHFCGLLGTNERAYNILSQLFPKLEKFVISTIDEVVG